MRWAATFVVTRRFGWGLPYSCLIPFADMLNHHFDSRVEVDLFHRNLHLTENKIYFNKYNFNEIELWQEN
jgi:hypothetical protein